MKQRADRTRAYRGQIIRRGIRCYLIRWFVGRDDDERKVYRSVTVRGPRSQARAILDDVLALHTARPPDLSGPAKQRLRKLL